MSEASRYSKEHLQLIEDLAATGFTLFDVAGLLGLDEKRFKSDINQQIELKNAWKQGEKRLKLIDADAKRRSELERESKWLIPTKSDLERIEELARNGWSEAKIADIFNVSVKQFFAAKNTYPQLDEALKRGYAGANGVKVQNDIQAWKPTPEDLKKIETLAEEGLTMEGIAVEMNIHIDTLYAKVADVPEIRAASESGRTRLKNRMIRRLVKLADAGNLKAIEFYLKTQDRKHFGEDKRTVTETILPEKKATIIDLPMRQDPDEFEREAARMKQEYKQLRENVEKAENSA